MAVIVPRELVRVEGSGLVLRAYRPGDASDLLAAFADQGIVSWNPGPAGPDAAAEFSRRRNDWSEGDHASWAVADETDRLVGSVSVHSIDPDQADAEVGYWVAPWARRGGVATRAVRAASGFAFGRMRLHRLYLYHAVDNPGSCAGCRLPPRGDAPGVVPLRRRYLPRRAPARAARLRGGTVTPRWVMGDDVERGRIRGSRLPGDSRPSCYSEGAAMTRNPS